MNTERLTEAVRKSLQCEGFDRPAEVSVLLVGDEEMRAMNREYRGLDRPTDVLSFSQLGDEDLTPEDCPVAIGDVIISVPTASRQAAERGRSPEDEMVLLSVHGVLHLLGYDDETDEGAAEMRSREEAVLRRL